MERAAVDAEVGPAEVVDQDEHHVGRRLARSRCGCRSEEKQSQQQRFGALPRPTRLPLTASPQVRIAPLGETTAETKVLLVKVMSLFREEEAEQ